MTHHPSCPASRGHPECSCPRRVDPELRVPGWAVWLAIAITLAALWGGVAVVVWRGWSP